MPEGGEKETKISSRVMCGGLEIGVDGETSQSISALLAFVNTTLNRVGTYCTASLFKRRYEFNFRPLLCDAAAKQRS